MMSLQLQILNSKEPMRLGSIDIRCMYELNFSSEFIVLAKEAVL